MDAQNPDGTAGAQAPGKVIIAGEHFVVLGAPAVAMAINLHSRATARPTRPGTIQVEADIPLHLAGKQQADMVDTRGLLEPLRLAAKETLTYIGRGKAGVNVDVECDIPVGAGLGSSASTTVAIINAVAGSQRRALTRKEMFQIAFGPEKYLHGKPSGVDQAACAYGGVIRFIRPNNITPLRLERVPSFLVCDTGIHRPTRRLVNAVVRRSEREKNTFENHLDDATEVSEAVVRALKAGDDEELGLLMNYNQHLLVDIGVSHGKLDKLIEVARDRGALGAKLTGAGGGGCLIALCEDEIARRKLARALRRENGIPYKVEADPLGVVAMSDGRVLK